jgi:two-component system invasion response regulator UvrY
MPHHPIRVVIVDDHRLFAESIALTLETDQNIRVVGFAEDGVEAVDLARRLRPDIVLMDLQMPRLNGVEATRRIRRIYPDMKIVAMSGAAPDDMVDLAYEAGAVCFVSKDRAVSELSEAIRRTAAAGKPLGLRLLRSTSLRALELRPTG